MKSLVFEIAIIVSLSISQFSFAQTKENVPPTANKILPVVRPVSISESEDQVVGKGGDASFEVGSELKAPYKFESEVDIPVTESGDISAPSKSKQKVTQELSEAEIPLSLQGKKIPERTDSNPITRMVISLLAVSAFGLLILFVTKKWGQNQKKSGSHIRVITQHHLGPKKSLAIIKVAGEFILVGITDQNINMIKSLSLLDEDIPEDSPKSFDKVFSRLNKKTSEGNGRNPVVKTASRNWGGADEDEDFAFRGLEGIN